MLWLIPLVATLTSVVFFRSSPDDQSLVGRVLVSAHGVTIAAFFVGAMSVYWSNLSRADFAIPFCIGLLLPVALMIFSFFKFQTGKDFNASAKQDQQSFDESRGVILEGDAAREVAEMCGAKDDSKGWRISSSDIKSLEKELAPLLADDLRRVRANASPHQYYRQYASGTFANRDAIFVNGFHESHLSTFNDTSWQTRPRVHPRQREPFLFRPRVN